MRGEVDFATSLRSRVAALAGRAGVGVRARPRPHRADAGRARADRRRARARRHASASSRAGSTRSSTRSRPTSASTSGARTGSRSRDGVLSRRRRRRDRGRRGQGRSAARRGPHDAGVPLSRTIAIGDGANDLRMMAERGSASRSTPSPRCARAPTSWSGPVDLREVIPLPPLSRRSQARWPMSEAGGSVAAWTSSSIPGLWLDASSWDDVDPALEAAGHTVHPLTMPGVGVAGAGVGRHRHRRLGRRRGRRDRRARRARRRRRPQRRRQRRVGRRRRPPRPGRAGHLRRHVPARRGRGISEFEVVDGVIPFPGWDSFDEPEVDDLDADARARIEPRAPRRCRRGCPTDPLALTDDRRHECR